MAWHARWHAGTHTEGFRWTEPELQLDLHVYCERLERLEKVGLERIVDGAYLLGNRAQSTLVYNIDLVVEEALGVRLGGAGAHVVRRPRGAQLWSLFDLTVRNATNDGVVGRELSASGVGEHAAIEHLREAPPLPVEHLLQGIAVRRATLVALEVAELVELVPRSRSPVALVDQMRAPPVEEREPTTSESLPHNGVVACELIPRSRHVENRMEIVV